MARVVMHRCALLRGGVRACERAKMSVSASLDHGSMWKEKESGASWKSSEEEKMTLNLKSFVDNMEAQRKEREKMLAEIQGLRDEEARMPGLKDNEELLSRNSRAQSRTSGPSMGVISVHHYSK